MQEKSEVMCKVVNLALQDIGSENSLFWRAYLEVGDMYISSLHKMEVT